MKERERRSSRSGNDTQDTTCTVRHAGVKLKLKRPFQSGSKGYRDSEKCILSVSGEIGFFPLDCEANYFWLKRMP